MEQGSKNGHIFMSINYQSASFYWCMTQISKQLYGFDLVNMYFEMNILNLKYAVFVHNKMEPLVEIQLCDKINIHLNYDKQKL